MTTQKFAYFGPQQQKQKPRNIKKSPVGLILGVFIVGTFTFMVGGGWFIYRLVQTLPTVDEIANIQQSLVSQMLGRDGTVVHEFGTERRFWVPFDSMPPTLYNAVIAIEDRRFYEHWGIDLRRIASAVVVDIVHAQFAQGASTLTQQLSRGLFLTAQQNITRKLREILTALVIEHYYTKNEILELYLNQIYLGGGCYGMESAAQHYFSKHVQELTIGECATLAGTIQRPEGYRCDKPKNIPRITARRNTVLDAMCSMKVITPQVAQAEKLRPMQIKISQNASEKAGYFVEMVRRHIIEKYGEDELYNGGLTIQTTLDAVAQDSSEAGMERQLVIAQDKLYRVFYDMNAMGKKLGGMPKDTFVKYWDSLYEIHGKEWNQYADSLRPRKVQGALVAIDDSTGGILAFIGGRDFGESKYNRATQSFRQPGSSFKPFVYTAAIEHGFSPMTQVLDQPVTIETPEGVWRPENFDKEFLGKVPLRKAFYKSLNLPAIQVFLAVGGDTVVNTARRMGITAPLQPYPSLAIGSCEVQPFELISSYTIFPNKGKKIKPYFIESIIDKNGKILERHVPEEPEEVLSRQTAFIMTDMMADVVRRGTAASIPGLGFDRPVGGKTGTTNNYTDAWFIGFTPQITCGVWMGIDEKRSLGRNATGAEVAVPAWVPAMKALHRNLPVAYFSMPDSLIQVTVCKESFKIATRACPEPRNDYLRYGQTADTCDIHGAKKVHYPADRFKSLQTDEKKAQKRKMGMF